MRVINIKIAQKRLNKISDVFNATGQIFFASVLIGPIISGDFNLWQMLSGLFLTAMSWVVAVLIV